MELESGSGDVLIANLTPCHLQFDTTGLKVIAAVRASVGVFSALCCCAVVFIMILFQKYKFFTQRLIFYLALISLVHSFSYALARINYYTPRRIDDPYCYFGGLFNHYTSAIELLSIWCITISLCARAWFNKTTEKFEPVYVCVMLFLPALWFWIPLWRRSYGTAGATCGIKFVDADCTPSEGKWIAFGIWYIPLYVSMFLIFFAMLLVACKAVKNSTRWEGNYNPSAKAKQEIMRREVRPLIWYPIIFLLLNTFSFISQIYNAANPEHPQPELSYFSILTAPLRGAFISLAYTLDSDTIRRLFSNHCKTSCMAWVKMSKVKEYAAVYSDTTDSYKLFNSED